MTEKETYTLEVECNNCDFVGKTDIPKGSEVEQHPCPNCGTLKLERHFEIITQSYI